MKIQCPVESITVEALNHPSDLTIYINGMIINVDSQEDLRIEDNEYPDECRYSSAKGQSGRQRVKELREWVFNTKNYKKYGRSE